jgi:2-isopropylmalate synthase
MIDIQIYDTTLRDGEQAPGAAMRPEQKLAIAMALQQLGVDTIEAGFPASSPDDARASANIARECRGVRVAAFARTMEQDIAAAAAALRAAEHPRMTLVMPVSDLHVRHKLGIGSDQALAMLTASVISARNMCAEVEVITEDASRADLPFLCRVARTAIEAGACALTVADTVGYATPPDIRHYLETLQREVPELADILLGIHCHDDLGLATINTLTGLEAGARQAHCTINGVGERAGNAALEEIVMAMNSRPDRFPYRNRLDTTRLYSTSMLVSEVTGFVIPPNKAIVGGNAFAHGAGMHQDGMFKASAMYEIIQPEKVGAPSRQFPITRHSGRKGLAARLAEKRITLSDSDLTRLFSLVKERLTHSTILSDEELLALMSKLE